jgi:ABC-type multidrug transport system ATPase subunit
MGPSGSGKTTLLNVLAHRTTANAEILGEVMINNERASLTAVRNLSSFVEQEDALIGSLTVKETISFAARLALPPSVSKKERVQRVDDLLDAFGIQGQANTLVGTPIRKGISGGQKRRLSVASQLIADPRILFLDEPTSGLDSAASFEVMNYIKRVAVQHRLIVVASIHQPSTATFALFDQLMLLSGGKTCYFGPRAGIQSYFDNISHPIPAYTNPAEFLLELVNVDFAKDNELSRTRLQFVHSAWAGSAQAAQAKSQIQTGAQPKLASEKASSQDYSVEKRNARIVTFVLLHRSWIKSYRDVIAYGIRIAMYTGLAIMAS